MEYISNFLIALLQRVLKWVIPFFKRKRNADLLQKTVNTKNTLITNITVVNPIIIIKK